jgi:hypothetical protein
VHTNSSQVDAAAPVRRAATAATALAIPARVFALGLSRGQARELHPHATAATPLKGPVRVFKPAQNLRF